MYYGIHVVHAYYAVSITYTCTVQQFSALIVYAGIQCYVMLFYSFNYVSKVVTFRKGVNPTEHAGACISSVQNAYSTLHTTGTIS